VRKRRVKKIRNDKESDFESTMGKVHVQRDAFPLSSSHFAIYLQILNIRNSLKRK